MKVLSLTEPMASLVRDKKKLVETRSWRTTYRGELYIHASSTKVPKVWQENESLMALVGDIPLSFGYIICKCKLVDCIYMTEAFIKKMKEEQPQEIICGEYKEGRYAWVLEDVEVIEPIEAKGRLGVWNYEK